MCVACCLSFCLVFRICMFKDPSSGVECDISVHNALALRNTQLLRMYSAIDPRVRWLAYTLKRWAKARHLNDPSDSTLSSYGLLLLLFHFLQTRSPPVLPNLQRMPPCWPNQPQGNTPLPVVPVCPPPPRLTARGCTIDGQIKRQRQAAVWLCVSQVLIMSHCIAGCAPRRS